MSGNRNLANAQANDPSFKTGMTKQEAAQYVPQTGGDAPKWPSGSKKVGK